MKLRLLIVPLLVALFVAGCTLNVVTGSGDIVSVDRNVSNFDSIAFSASGDLEIVQGDREGLTLEGDDNIVDLITTEVRNGTLNIGLENQLTMIRPTRALRITVYVDNLESVQLSGSGTVRADELVSDDLSMQISGSGEVFLPSLQAETFNLQVSGSGDIEATGSVTDQFINISGSGAYNAGELATDNAAINVSGSGDATLWVTDELTIDVSGSGNVRYYGDAQVSTSVSGSGNVEALGSK